MSDQGDLTPQGGRRVADALVELLEKTGSRSAMLYGFVLGTCVVGVIIVSKNLAEGDPYLLYSAGVILLCGMAYSLVQLFYTAHQIRKREVQRAAE